ncbi:replication initiator protein A [Deinococcus alpinitundrae]|uniref:replication initiator protein A n=1 Tax=Deinococcus alpinitundrae TaxID=468913 RepID=UPI001379882E|nr:replication initiator protein A [Deinococcus alpinitundrae]
MSRVPTVEEAEQAIVLREDLNVGQLGLISIQRKIAEDYAQWKVSFNRNGIPSEIECNGIQKYGVPHGIDNDTYLALQELYIEQGCPDDGLFGFTMYRLLQLCGLADTGANRQMLRVSLERLSSTQYWISGAWRSHEDDDWVTVGFRLIEKLIFTRSRRDTDGAKQIAVTLPRELTRNIRNGYFKPVSATLLRQLGQPARAAYRVLDSLRHDPVQHHDRAATLTISLMDLAQRCGIASDRPDKIRRTLEPIHEMLIQTEYLTGVVITGVGRKQSLTYSFGQAVPEPDARLVELLVALKVPLVAAKKAAFDYAGQVEDGVAQARAILTHGYSPANPVGFVLDVVRSYGNGKYAWPSGTHQPKEVEAARTRIQKQVKKEVAKVEAELAQPSRDDLLRVLSFLLVGEHLRAEDLATLPTETLISLRSQVLTRPGAERRQVAQGVRRLLAEQRELPL